VGQAVQLGSTTATVVGVVEPRFDSLGSVVDAWMPLSALSAAQPQASLAWEPSVKSGNCCIGMAGRLAPGVAARTAGEELQLLHERFAAGGRGRAGRVAVFGTAGISGPGAARYALFGVFGAAVLLVLVLACANVGNLQLARGLARRREIATRMSIGASRGRIVRQLLTEGLVLAGAAGALAVALAAALPPLVFRIIDEEIPPHMASRLAPGWEVGLFTAAICVAACMVFALAPALQATRLTIPLGAIDRASTRSTRLPLRALLLATQIAVCTVLLAGAGLVTRAIAHAMRFDPGFAVQGVEIVSATLPTDGYTPGQRSDFAGQILAAIESSGGEPVALASHPPINRAPFVMPVTLPHEGPRDLRSIRLRQVSSGYFDVLGIPMAAGRMFGPRPSDEAVVNETLARALWPGESAIGRIVNHVDRAGKTLRAYTIVGVVRDAHLTSLEQVEGTIFTPARSGMFLTRGGPEAVERIRAAALAISPSAVVATRPLTDELRNYLVQSRAGAALAWAIGLLGLTLAIVGVFGVFAYAVEERRREIGVRMALGAAGPQILRMLAATSGRAMISGLAAGLVVSLACGPLLRSYLYGLSPLDPGAYALVAAILAGAGVLATFIPARRACRIDPAVTLRAE
jgi:predicted permease